MIGVVLFGVVAVVTSTTTAGCGVEPCDLVVVAVVVVVVVIVSCSVV